MQQIATTSNIVNGRRRRGEVIKVCQWIECTLEQALADGEGVRSMCLCARKAIKAKEDEMKFTPAFYLSKSF